jgi:tetratricopeptide (TPR) repeat protein
MSLTPNNPETRLRFDELMNRCGEIRIEGSPKEALAAASANMRLLKEAVALASELSDGRQSVHHVEVMLRSATSRAQLGIAVQNEKMLEDALTQCEEALRLSTDLGTPRRRLEAEGLALRGNLFAYFGKHEAAVEHLEEVIATMEPAVESLEAMRRGGNPAEIAMLDLTNEDRSARELLDAARESLAEVHAARHQASDPERSAKKSWWKVW